MPIVTNRLLTTNTADASREVALLKRHGVDDDERYGWG
jgi:hypothetical protein